MDTIENQYRIDEIDEVIEKIAADSVLSVQSEGTVSIPQTLKIASDIHTAMTRRVPENLNEDLQKSFTDMMPVNQYTYIKTVLLACRALDVTLTVSTEDVKTLNIEEEDRFSLFAGSEISYANHTLTGVIKSPEITTRFDPWSLATLSSDEAVIGVGAIEGRIKTPEQLVQHLNKLFSHIINKRHWLI